MQGCGGPGKEKVEVLSINKYLLIISFLRLKNKFTPLEYISLRHFSKIFIAVDTLVHLSE